MRLRKWIAPPLALLATACGLEHSTSALGVARFREVSAAEAHRLLTQPGTLLVQAIGSREAERPLRAAEPMIDMQDPQPQIAGPGQFCQDREQRHRVRTARNGWRDEVRQKRGSRTRSDGSWRRPSGRL